MKKLIAGFLCIAVHLSAPADASKRESVEALLELTQADAMMDNMYAQMDQMFVGMGQQLGIKPSEQPLFEEYMQNVVAAMREEMSWEKMEDPMIDIYLKHYTEEEIQDMLAFYRSDTGRSMVEKMPQVMNESMVVAQQMMRSFMPRIQELAMEFREKLEAHRAAEPDA